MADQVQYGYNSVYAAYAGYLSELYNSEQCPVGIGPPTSAEKLLPSN